MKCSSCSKGTLEASFLEGLFACHTCNHCEGNLFMLSDYMRWHSLNPDVEPEMRDDIEIEAISEDTRKAMICPLSGRLMTKYRISADTEHRVDLSPTINAVWLDKGEWALLKHYGLTHKLNNIFTQHWQHEVHDAESSEVLSDLYQRRFGEHYDQIKTFKRVLDSLENRSDAIAYLLSDDPYKT